MKTKKIELDVDFIGEKDAMTIAEEKALSEFFKNRKVISKKSIDNKKLKSVNRKKVTV